MLGPSLCMKKMRVHSWVSEGTYVYFYSSLVWQDRDCDSFLYHALNGQARGTV